MNKSYIKRFADFVQFILVECFFCSFINIKIKIKVILNKVAKTDGKEIREWGDLLVILDNYKYINVNMQYKNIKSFDALIR
ncbi:hypothetical protein IGJ51_001068 [Enterococcus sp. DIV0802c]|uniref:hypothetical protein n=1 Tax=Enterococcus sp. DIV0802c TaxID=2774743 RepID=UPI003F1FF738